MQGSDGRTEEKREQRWDGMNEKEIRDFPGCPVVGTSNVGSAGSIPDQVVILHASRPKKPKHKTKII